MKLLKNLIFLVSYVAFSEVCIDKKSIEKSIAIINQGSTSISTIYGTIASQDTLIVSKSSKYKKYSILFIGGLEGNLESANKVIDFADYLCENYSKNKNIISLLDYADFHFIPIGNQEFFYEVSKNCTEEDGEQEIQVITPKCQDF